jgi:hypothetical protein
MALLQLLSEEPVAEDSLQDYVEDLYKVVCVAERPASPDAPGSLVRSTYVVDWEQLVHLLEDYTLFGEDIVEVRAMSNEEAQVLRGGVEGSQTLARA